MKRWLWGLFCVVVSSVALAAGAAAGQSAEASMLVTGAVVIAPDGSVRSHTVDQPDKLSPAIIAFIDKAVAAWKFVPVVVDSKPVTAQAKMNLRLIADPAEDGSFVVRVGGASFGNGEPGEQLSAIVKRRTWITYPSDALRVRAGGTVYLLLKVGRQGQVLDAVAEQVNLTVRGNDRQMAKLRSLFAKESLAASKHWTYAVPTSGSQVNDPYWVARVPVIFRPNPKVGTRAADDQYGQWQSYMPGPRESVTWLDDQQVTAGSVDTTPEGGLVQLGQGPKLASPLSGG